MSTKPRRKRKMSPREAMHAKRAKAPEVNPCPPGPSGGQYKPLSNDEIQQIYDNALRILSEIGMGDVPDALMEKALECGAHQNEQGRLCYSKAMIEDILAGACRKFTYYGRDPKHDFEVGGDKVHFGTGGAAVQTMDLDTHNYRSATLRDLYDFTRLADSLTNVSWFTRCCVATDVEGIKDLDVNTAYALLKGTTKPVGTSFTVAETVDPIIDMFDIAMGGEITLLNAASAQISNWLGLPSGAAASMSDSKAVDAQMGLEKAMTSLGVGLAGCNMVYESVGNDGEFAGRIV